MLNLKQHKFHIIRLETLDGATLAPATPMFSNMRAAAATLVHEYDRNHAVQDQKTGYLYTYDECLAHLVKYEVLEFPELAVEVAEAIQ